MKFSTEKKFPSLRRGDFLHEKFLVWAMYQLLKSDVIYTDETPLNVAGKTSQAIIVTNDNAILVLAFPSKSIESVENMGILPNYNGIVVSDCNATTLHFKNCTHALCGVHLIRDLKACIDKEGMHWAELFLKFITDLKDNVKENGAINNEEFSKKILKHYNLLITKGLNEVEDKKEMGMPTQKSSALLRRLMDRYKEYLLFAIDTRVAFDNTISERGIRMIKIHLKISGCFISLLNANQYCLTKSYIDTCRKYGIDSYNSIRMALEGKCPDFMNFDDLDDKDLLDLIHNIIDNNKKIYSKKSSSDDNSSSNNNSSSNCKPQSGNSSSSNDKPPSNGNSSSNGNSPPNNNSSKDNKTQSDNISDKKVASFYSNNQIDNFELQSDDIDRSMTIDNNIYKCNSEIKNLNHINELSLDYNKYKQDNENSSFRIKNIGTSFFNICVNAVSVIKDTGKKIINYIVPSKISELTC